MECIEELQTVVLGVVREERGRLASLRGELEAPEGDETSADERAPDAGSEILGVGPAEWIRFNERNDEGFTSF